MAYLSEGRCNTYGLWWYSCVQDCTDCVLPVHMAAVIRDCVWLFSRSGIGRTLLVELGGHYRSLLGPTQLPCPLVSTVPYDTNVSALWSTPHTPSVWVLSPKNRGQSLGMGLVMTLTDRILMSWKETNFLFFSRKLLPFMWQCSNLLTRQNFQHVIYWLDYRPV